MLMPDQALQRGEELIAAGRFKEAVKVLNEVARADTPNWEVQCAFAEALIQTGRFKDALNAARLAEQLRPGSPRVQQMLAEALLALNQLDSAEAATTRVVELAPHSAAGYDLRGRIASARKRYGEAEMQAREALRLEPDNWGFNNNLGVALRHLKRDKEAIAAFEKAALANPNARLVRRNLFSSTSAYTAGGGLIAFLIGLRLLPDIAAQLHQPLRVVSALFYGSIIAAVAAGWLWRRYRMLGMSPQVKRLYREDWMRERSRLLLRAAFRTLPVMAVVLAVIWLGFTQNVGFLPWIVAGGVLVVVWWFAWQPSWRRLEGAVQRLRDR
jgi:Flp pilus assembly protein TadD